jgi:hypothetical protein
VVPFSDGVAVPAFWTPPRDFQISEGICETAVAALAVLYGWGELNTALRGGMMAPCLALAMQRGTMAARSTTATYELAHQCVKSGIYLANASHFGPATKKIEEAASRDPESTQGRTAETGDPVKQGAAGGDRAGKNFTKKGGEQIVDENRQKNNGTVRCENCGLPTEPSQRSTRGVTPSPRELQKDHIHPKSLGGDGTPKNGQVLCRSCNRAKSDKAP